MKILTIKSKIRKIKKPSLTWQGKRGEKCLTKTLKSLKSSKPYSALQSSSKMAKLLAKYEKFTPPVRGGQIDGKVVQILKDKILVDFGGKSEGEISGREFAELKKSGTIPGVGETISAQVVEPENEAGATVLTVAATTQDAAWEKLETLAKEEKETEAAVKSLAKSGILVEVFGIRGFIPAATADPAVLQNFNKFLQKRIKVRIIEVNKAANRLICNTVTKPAAEELENLKKQYTEGQKYQGKVTAVLPFGIVVSFSDFATFVPSFNLAWEKIEDVQNSFKVGQETDFVFLGIDKISGRSQISPKLTKPDPIVEFAKNNPKDSEVAGRVLRTSEFGVFVSLADGIEGLIHISKIPPDVKFGEGQKVTCTVDFVDVENRRISLSPVLKAKPVGYR